MLRRLLCGIVLCALIVVILPQTPSAQVQAQTQAEITLVIWGDPGGGCINDPENDWNFCAFSRMVDQRWREKYPHINLVWEEHGWDEELRVNLLNAIEAGTEPDITIGESFMPVFAREGLFLPLHPSPELAENLIPSPVQGVTWDGELYGVSLFTGVFTLEVNADVLLANGYDIDSVDLSSWEGVQNLAEAITAQGSGIYYGFSILGPTNYPAAAMFRVAPYLYQVGTNFCNMPTCDAPTLNDPRAVPVYEWMRALYTQSPPDVAFSGDEAFVFSQLFSGVSAMQTAGTWHIAWAQESGCIDCRYYPLPMPPNGQRANVVVGNAMYAGLASTEHPEEVRLFLEFLASDEIQTALFWTGGVGRLPTTYTAVQALYDAMDGDISTLPAFYTDVLNFDPTSAPAEAQKYKVFIDELVEGDLGILPTWSAELNYLWNAMFAEILTSDRPIQDILDEYQTQAEALMTSTE